MIIDRMKVLSLWQSAQVAVDSKPMAKHLAGMLVSFRAGFYDEVEKATQIPWYVVGAIDYREENFAHDRYLGNGDPLFRATTHVPRGRGPFRSWYAGAIDALHCDGMQHLPAGGHWDIVTALIKLEAYNGMGYAARGHTSPYVWAHTNHQMPGKYVADGEYDPTALDRQMGCAAILLSLRDDFLIDVGEE